MKKTLLTMIMIAAMLVSCKKADAEDTKVYDQTKGDKITEIITKLGGRMPRTPMELIDAEILDLNNKTSFVSERKGKVIFLNLWATWCPPCRHEMPSMEKLAKEFKEKDFVILAVSQGEDQSVVKDFLKANKYTFPIFTDPKSQVSSSYGTGSIPTTYIVDKKGFIIAMFVGGKDWYSSEALELFNELLK